MGISMSHGAGQFSYSGFSRWRRMVAIELDLIGPGDCLFYKQKWDDQQLNETPIDWEEIDKDTDWQGNWTAKPKDPIWYLLAHSDCDGIIKPEHMLPLAERLAPIAEKVDDNYGAVGFRPTERFITGLRAAAAANEEINFH